MRFFCVCAYDRDREIGQTGKTRTHYFWFIHFGQIGSHAHTFLRVRMPTQCVILNSTVAHLRRAHLRLAYISLFVSTEAFPRAHRKQLPPPTCASLHKTYDKLYAAYILYKRIMCIFIANAGTITYMYIYNLYLIYAEPESKSRWFYCVRLAASSLFVVRLTMLAVVGSDASLLAMLAMPPEMLNVDGLGSDLMVGT